MGVQNYRTAANTFHLAEGFDVNTGRKGGYPHIAPQIPVSIIIDKMSS